MFSTVYILNSKGVKLDEELLVTIDIINIYNSHFIYLIRFIAINITGYEFLLGIL